MATNLTQTTFATEYKDDYRDSDHYHRILFNNGRALQARELTQMQTIIQAETARMGKFLFKEGGIYGSAGAVSSGFNPVGYVKLVSFGGLGDDYSTLVGTRIYNNVGTGDGCTAIVKAAIPATLGGDPATLLVSYISSAGETSSDTEEAPATFNANDTLNYSTSAGTGTLTVAANDQSDLAIGKGSMIETPAFDTFVAGHMVTVEAQTLVIDKYNPNPTEVIGFELYEEIITTADDNALYDNAGSTPNLTSPGADRYRIRLVLQKESEAAAGKTFYRLYEMIQGVVRKINHSDELGEITNLLAARTFDINGDFIVKNPGNEFNLSVQTDSDTDYLRYVVNGGTAFIKGNRVERAAAANPLRVQKPRSTSTDLDTKTNTFVSSRYGNYVLADSANFRGLIGKISNFDTINLYDNYAFDSAIGTARIRSIDEYENEYRIHLFDVTLNDTKSFRNVLTIGTDSADYATLKTVQGVVSLIDKEDNSLLFPLGRRRVQSVSNVTMPVTRIDTDTVVGGTASFQVSDISNNTFTDGENWILQYDSAGEHISPPAYDAVGGTTTTISNLENGKAVRLLAYENKPAVLKIKRRQSNQTESVSISNREFKLSKADIYLFRSVVEDATGLDITNRFIFDNGQRDNFYTVGGGRVKQGKTVPGGTITVTYDYFTHTAGDYFAGKNSYPDIAYEKVPFYATNTGKSYRLTDVIDMRPVKNNTGANFTGTGAVIEPLPKNASTITVGSISNWQPRIDVIHMSPTGTLQVTSGETDNSPILPNIKPQDLILHTVTLNPYTFDERDLTVRTVDHRGFNMSQIRNMDDRLRNVEKLTALTIAEQDLQALTVRDPNDATLPDRVKQGITGDTFTSNIQSHLSDIDYRARLDKNLGMVGPLVFGRTSSLYYDSDESVSTKIYGNTVWPKFTEEVMINQNVASKAINVNQFELNKNVGSGEIAPPRQSFSTRKKVDVGYELGSTAAIAEIGTSVVSSQGQENTDGGVG